MKHYAGLDVSFDETSVCIVDEAGAYVAEAKVASDPAALADYLQSSGLNFGRVGLEACPLSQWLYRSLAAPSFPVVCVEVRGGLKGGVSCVRCGTVVSADFVELTLGLKDIS